MFTKADMIPHGKIRTDMSILNRTAAYQFLCPLRAEAAALVNAQYESFGEIPKGDLISLENRFDVISDFWREIATPNYWEAYNALNHNDAKTVEDFRKSERNVFGRLALDM